MNDKTIRNILIEYLQTTNNEIRIYQEKSIGSSICDVMAVTDKLIGFEIKSDLDNYTRLTEQIKAYDSFFDKNYIVVSDKHSASASDKVPSHWGIIVIRENDVIINRNAKSNKKVSRRKQLSILWKLELKNLLLKNNMPLFAQKEKGYISDRIAENVDEDILGKQIAEELINRDYSVFETQTVKDSSSSDFPEQELVDTLSEKDLTDFTLDKWISLYKKAKEIRESKEEAFKKPMTERTPHKIPYTDIAVSLGVPWIKPSIVNDFIIHLLRIKGNVNIVEYESITGSWHINSKSTYSHNNSYAEAEYGLKRYNALQIIEATLNLREIKLFDGTVYNEKDTVAALEKQKLIVAEFEKWVWLDHDRIWEIEDAYNRIFANYDKKQYDGSKLTFPDMSSNFQLFPYQKDAVQKILETDNTLLAFDVGAGKTFIMIAAAMNMRISGMSRKNMFVVPNHIVGQWEKIFTDLYPNAKVLAIEPKTFKANMRSKVLRQIKDGDYDGIIIAYSCFELIPLSSHTILDNMKGRLDKIDEAVKGLRHSVGKYYTVSFGEAPLNKEKEYIKKLARDFIDSMSPIENSNITFEDLEINTLFVDEAHNYKNLPIKTRMKRLTGINTKGSMKCLDMLHKIRYVQSSNGGRGIVFATGTPLCNSISDAYSMQMYLQYDEMQSSHLDVFDNWVKTFAKPEQVMEIDVDTSKYRIINRFARFHNLPDLSLMFSQIAMFYAVNDKDNLPQLEGYTDVVIDKYQELSDYMQYLCERTEEIRSGKVHRVIDNMLKVSTDGRKAALDLKLVDREQPSGKCSKIDNCIENVISLYGKYENTTQLIFCDYSTPKGENFSVYKEIREKLIQNGIPQKEIAFIHNYNTESKKVELYEKFNSSKVRILIGSTFKLGIGANVQTKLKAIHHLDVPWRPADMVQREGRILRRGNENSDVFIYRYIAEGSFDSYSWQLLETKQRFISQFLSGSTYQRTVTDLENNVLSYAEVKALALSEPLMKKLAETENEIKNLRMIVANEIETQNRLKSELKKLEFEIPKLNARCNTTIQNANYLGLRTESEFEQGYELISGLLTTDVVFRKVNLTSEFSVLGFRILLPNEQDEKKPYILLERQHESYAVQMGESAKGNARRIINFLKNFNKTVESVLSNFRSAKERQKQYQQTIANYNSEYKLRLEKCEELAAHLKERIGVKSNQNEHI